LQAPYTCLKSFFSFLNESYLAAGVKALQEVGIEIVSVDPCSDAECAAESASLTRWQFQDLKNAAKRKPEIDLVLHGSDEYGLARKYQRNFSTSALIYVLLLLKGGPVGEGFDESSWAELGQMVNGNARKSHDTNHIRSSRS
jgi:hypothetical protein